MGDLFLSGIVRFVLVLPLKAGVYRGIDSPYVRIVNRPAPVLTESQIAEREPCQIG